MPHVVHVSGAQPWHHIKLLGTKKLALSGTLKHAQIAAIEWNREAIARVKTGVGVQGTCHTRSVLYGPLISETGRVGAGPQRAGGSVAPFQSSMQEIEDLQD